MYVKYTGNRPGPAGRIGISVEPCVQNKTYVNFKGSTSICGSIICDNDCLEEVRLNEVKEFQIGDPVVYVSKNLSLPARYNLTGIVAGITRAGALLIRFYRDEESVPCSFCNLRLVSIPNTSYPDSRNELDLKTGDRIIYSECSGAHWHDKDMGAYAGIRGVIDMVYDEMCTVRWEGEDVVCSCTYTWIELVSRADESTCCGGKSKPTFKKGDKVKILRGRQDIMPGHPGSVHEYCPGNYLISVCMDDAPEDIRAFPVRDVALISCEDKPKMEQGMRIGTRVRFCSKEWPNSTCSGKEGTVCEQASYEMKKEKFWVKFDENVDGQRTWICELRDLEILSLSLDSVEQEVIEASCAIGNAKQRLAQAQARLEFFEDAGRAPSDNELKSFMVLQELASETSSWEKAKRLAELVTQGA